MIAVSTSSSNQTNATLAAALAISLIGANFVAPTASTATPWHNQLPCREDSRTSTAPRVTPIQLTKPSTPETQPPEWREEASWEARLPATLEAQHLLDTALNELQTEGMLEQLEAQTKEFIDRHGIAGIAVLEAKLIRPHNDLATEPLARRFLRALGNPRTPTIDAAAKHLLLSQLASESGGRRSAAASALGAFPSAATLTALQKRATVEKNRIVLATLNAHIRVLTANGISPTKVG
jgi:hypothetical protein